MKTSKEVKERINNLEGYMKATLMFISDNPDNQNEQILLDKVSKAASDKRLLEWVLN